MLAKFSSKKYLPIKLLALVMFMFMFGYMLVPIYNIVCAQLGINGKTNLVSTAVANQKINQTKENAVNNTESNANENAPKFPIKAEFITQTADAGWMLTPEVSHIVFQNNEVVTAYFNVKNVSSAKRFGRAVPSITPVSIAGYVNKIECFCMERQEFVANETKRVAVTFYMDKDTPDTVEEIVFGYTYFDSL